MGSCCTIPRAILTLAILIGAAIALWKLIPWEKAVQEVIPDFNASSLAEDVAGAGNIPFLSNNDDKSTLNPNGISSYDFIQCSETSKLVNRCCNGLQTNCDRRITDVMFATLHNAMSTEEDDFFGPNHDYSLEKALVAGYRGLSLDVCDCNPDPTSYDLKFCHGFCHGGTKDIKGTFEDIVQFLTDNPGEVIVIDFQMPENDLVLLEALHAMMLTVDGFVDLMYVHPPDTKDPWPVMGDLVKEDINKRIIIFTQNGPDCSEVGLCPDGIHHMTSHVSQTDFDYSTTSSITSYDQSCKVTRGLIEPTEFYWINHFVTNVISDKDANIEINNDDTIETRMEECSASYGGKIINFVSVDYWSFSELPRITQDYNTRLAAAAAAGVGEESNANADVAIERAGLFSSP